MLQMGISFFFDVVVSVLLLVVLVYAVRLNRHIVSFVRYRKEFEKLFKEFIDSTKRAEIVLKEIKSKSLTNAKDIQDTLARGQYLVDDLEFLLKKSSETIEVLEKLNRQGKGRDFIDPDHTSTSLRPSKQKGIDTDPKGGLASLMAALGGEDASEDDARDFLKALQKEEDASQNEDEKDVLVLDEEDLSSLKGFRKVR